MKLHDHVFTLLLLKFLRWRFHLKAVRRYLHIKKCQNVAKKNFVEIFFGLKIELGLFHLAYKLGKASGEL